jgi:hypothetical protein
MYEEYKKASQKNVLKVTRCAYDHLSLPVEIFVFYLLHYIFLTFHEIMLFMDLVNDELSSLDSIDITHLLISQNTSIQIKTIRFVMC